MTNCYVDCVAGFRWLPFVINLFANLDTIKPAVPADKLNSFFSCVSTLISNQVFCLFTCTWCVYAVVYL